MFYKQTPVKITGNGLVARCFTVKSTDILYSVHDSAIKVYRIFFYCVPAAFSATNDLETNYLEVS